MWENKCSTKLLVTIMSPRRLPVAIMYVDREMNVRRWTTDWQNDDQDMIEQCKNIYHSQ